MIKKKCFLAAWKEKFIYCEQKFKNIVWEHRYLLKEIQQLLLLIGTCDIILELWRWNNPSYLF